MIVIIIKIANLCHIDLVWTNQKLSSLGLYKPNMNDFWLASICSFIADFKALAKNCTKNTHNSLKNRGQNPYINKLVGVHSRNIYAKFEANLCSGLGEVEIFYDDGHGVIARVTLSSSVTKNGK